MSARVDDTLSIRAGRDAYFSANGFPAGGGYDAKWVKLKAFGIPFAFPNTEARKRQVPAHDIHHVLTGYGTDLVGEAEIGAWEIGSVCDGPARHLGLRVMGMANLWAPGRVFRAFVRGRHCKNFYQTEIDDGMLARVVGEARKELGLDLDPPPATVAERVAFLGFSTLAAAITWGPLPVLAALWWWLS